MEPSSIDVRSRIGETISGDVLEIGPGSEPFPVSSTARVVYADKRVGGRDETWPELVGAPRGPETQVDVDLDTGGLGPFADRHFDVAIASHVVEHVADPVRTIVELHRVVRVGGLVVFAVPDRTRTFDRVRTPTPAAHLLGEYEAGVTEVSDDHIVEFCEAIWRQPSFHPEPVRSWHDPARLDPDRLDLHRRRSIHVHCWNAEEFVTLLSALAVEGLAPFRLRDAWLTEDADARDDEFGLVLERIEDHDEVASDLVATWCSLVDHGGRDRARLVDLASALDRDVPSSELGQIPRNAVRSAFAALASADAARDQLRAELERVVASPSHRIGRFLTAPARAVRDRGDG